MSVLTLNQNSIYKNSRENFIINRDALYAFTRSISAINNSVYGIQPTRDQQISGIAIEDISANHSLCSDVWTLNANVDALKFFATRPFIPCDSVQNRDEIAKNPLAVYLTPITIDKEDADISAVSNDSYEWIFVFNNDISWEEQKEYADGQHYLSVAVEEKKGKWELIGSTSLTDEKIAELFNDVNDTIEKTATALSGAIQEEEAARKQGDEYVLSVVESISSDLSDAIIKEIDIRLSDDAFISSIVDRLCTEISTVIDDEISARKKANEELSEAITFLSTSLSTAIDSLSTDLSTALNIEILDRISADEQLSIDLTSLISDVSVDLSGKVKDVVNDLSALTLSVDQISTVFTTFKGSIETSASNLCLEISSEAKRAISVEKELSDIISSDYVKKSDLSNTIWPEISAFNEYVEDDSKIPYDIAIIINWNRQLHKALSAICSL